MQELLSEWNGNLSERTAYLYHVRELAANERAGVQLHVTQSRGSSAQENVTNSQVLSTPACYEPRPANQKAGVLLHVTQLPGSSAQENVTNSQVLSTPACDESSPANQRAGVL